MSRILSQEEVEALLKGVQTGRISTEAKKKAFEVKPYDFLNSPKPLKSAPGLDRVFQKFGSLFKNSLSTLLYKPLDLHTRPSEHVRFSEFVKMVQVPSSVNVIKLNPLNGNGLFIMETSLVFALVELFFGSHKVKLQKIEPRNFTSTEERVIKRIVLLALNDLANAWKDLFVLNPELVGSDINLESTGIATTSELIIKAEFQINVDEFSGKAFFAIPFSVIEPFSEQLVKKSPEIKDDEWISVLREAILDSEIEVIAELARLEFTFGEILNLKPGDVIALGVGVNDELLLRIEGIRKFKGVPGNSRGNQAVKITALC
ncbi:MAG: flagellar motor switch protein FliM [Thermodesulfovibrionales bacterium]|nr:flagellar motor switch protein FliM [Thermodesulfovibrionales bacterium]